MSNLKVIANAIRPYLNERALADSKSRKTLKEWVAAIDGDSDLVIPAESSKTGHIVVLRFWLSNEDAIEGAKKKGKKPPSPKWDYFDWVMDD